MENEKMICSVNDIHRVKEYPVLNTSNVDSSIKRIVRLVRDNAESEEIVLDDEIEIIIPSINKLNIVKDNINSNGVSLTVNNKKYTIYDDFYSFNGNPYTDETRDYLKHFNKFYAIISDSEIVFAIWYRNIISNTIEELERILYAIENSEKEM